MTPLNAVPLGMYLRVKFCNSFAERLMLPLHPVPAYAFRAPPPYPPDSYLFVSPYRLCWCIGHIADVLVQDALGTNYPPHFNKETWHGVWARLEDIDAVYPVSCEDHKFSL